MARCCSPPLLVLPLFLALYPSLAYATTIHVPGDHSTFIAAIDAASDGDTVLVAPGIYTGQGNRDLDFQGKRLLLRATEGPEATIIDCEGLGRGLSFGNGETQEATVEGFTITRASAEFGSAVWCFSSSPTIRSCIFSQNSSTYGTIYCYDSSITLIESSFLDNWSALHGGGLYCDLSSASVRNCVFRGNSVRGGTGGAAAFVSSSPSFADCTFASNESPNQGGALAIYLSTAVLTTCEFQSNAADRGGAIYSHGSTLTIRSNTLSGNRASIGGGVFLNGGASDMESIVFYANISDRGGAIYSLGATLALTSSTLARNEGAVGGGLLLSGGTATLERTIVAFSTRGAALLCELGSATVICSNFFGNAGGDITSCAGSSQSNFQRDPRFCDIELGNLNLAANSSCLPGQHPGGWPCDLIGALPQGCPPAAVEATTWGSLKARYR